MNLQNASLIPYLNGLRKFDFVPQLTPNGRKNDVGRDIVREFSLNASVRSRFAGSRSHPAGGGSNSLIRNWSVHKHVRVLADS